MATKLGVTATRLRYLLDYDPDTGRFTRRVRVSPNAGAGATAGCPNSSGYLVIRVDDELYTAHRLAWLYQTGDWPPTGIDHVNGDRADNRIANLRPANQRQNGANMRRPRNNTSGAKGVVWYKPTGKWRAQIGAENGFRHIGYFTDKAGAQAAYIAAATEMYGEFARAG